VSTSVVTVTDPHTTGVLQLNAQTLQETGRRYADPFGSPIASPGTTPRAWTGDRGYGNHRSDTPSGLTQVGARVYDPAAGAFTSPDPVINPGNPKQMHGVYSYAHQNPLAKSDPTGLEPRAIHQRAGNGTSVARTNSPAAFRGDQTAAKPYMRPHATLAAKPPVRSAPAQSPRIAEAIGNQRAAGIAEFKRSVDPSTSVFTPRPAPGPRYSWTRTNMGIGSYIVGGIVIAAFVVMTCVVLCPVIATAATMYVSAGVGASILTATKVAGAALTDQPSTSSIKSATAGRAAEVIASQSIRQRGPVLTGAMDRQTGQIFFGQNSGIPNPLHPALAARLAQFEGPGAAGKGIPGAHSEINAVNQGLFARPGASMNDFALYNVRLRGSAQGSPIPMCSNCSAILQGVEEIG